MAGDQRDDDEKASDEPASGDKPEAEVDKPDAPAADAADPVEAGEGDDRPEATEVPADDGKLARAKTEVATGDDVSKDRDDLGEPAGGHRVPERKAAAWGRPLARLDAAWTKFEARLCAVVLLLEIFALSLWVALKGLSTPPGSSSAGIVFRALLGATVLGLIGFFALRKKGKLWERIGSLGGVTLGILLAKVWADNGVEWSSNLVNWYQQASFLTLLGGLRGVGTRLTLLLALLGGSLATASGKHITIDLITRFLKPKARLPVLIAGWLGSALICGAAAWGFLDHIAIEDFRATADQKAGEKVSKVAEGVGEHFFLGRKQIGLDFKTLPHVIQGKPYGEWMTGAKWNEWLDGSGFGERYGKEKIEELKMTDLEATRSPIVIVPGRGEPRGELIKAANLVFPIGLLIIAIRFILLSLLALSGHMVVDPEAHVEGSDIERKRGEDGEPGQEKAS